MLIYISSARLESRIQTCINYSGADPVSDAIKKYYEAKTGHTSTILSPDVFLALHFDGTDRTGDPDGTQVC